MSHTQGSQAWHLARVGMVTASNITHVMSEPKSKSAPFSVAAETYMARLLGEMLTGVPAIAPKTEAMVRGSFLESEARLAYEISSGHAVTQTGLIKHPKIDGFAASPDGLVDSCGLVEIKCRNPQNYADLIYSREIPKDDLLQMMAQMSCTGRAWCDYVGYNPDMAYVSQITTIRIDRDEEIIGKMEEMVFKFVSELKSRYISVTNHS
jgi:putative phage-type endonuclease